MSIDDTTVEYRLVAALLADGPGIGIFRPMIALLESGGDELIGWGEVLDSTRGPERLRRKRHILNCNNLHLASPIAISKTPPPDDRQEVRYFGQDLQDMDLWPDLSFPLREAQPSC